MVRRMCTLSMQQHNKAFEVSMLSVRTQTSCQSIFPVTIKCYDSRETSRLNMLYSVSIGSRQQPSRRTMSSPAFVRFVSTP